VINRGNHPYTKSCAFPECFASTTEFCFYSRPCAHRLCGWPQIKVLKTTLADCRKQQSEAGDAVGSPKEDDANTITELSNQLALCQAQLRVALEHSSEQGSSPDLRQLFMALDSSRVEDAALSEAAPPQPLEPVVDKVSQHPQYQLPGSACLLWWKVDRRESAVLVVL